MKKQNYIFLIALFLNCNVFAQTTFNLPADVYSPEENDVVAVPAEWMLSESQALAGRSSRAKPEHLPKYLDRVFELNQNSLDQLPENFGHSGRTNPPPGAPPDWAPWHLEAVATDLSVSASGLIGLKTLKGTPAVQVYWKKKKTQTVVQSGNSMDTESAASLTLTGFESGQELEAQVEPVVQFLTKKKGVKNPDQLRRGLLERVNSFQSLAMAAQTVTGKDWWISGMRVDCVVDLTGKVFGWGSLGGEIRVRLDWKRLMKKNAQSATVSRSKGTSAETLLTALISNLDALPGSDLSQAGFAAQGFRFGFGVSEKGDFAIGKATVSLLGHINLSRVPKKNLLLQTNLLPPQPVRILDEPGKDAGLVEPEKFQAGLKKALNIGHSFAAIAKKRSEKADAKWNIYEMKVGFDSTLSWKVGLVETGRLATAEINYLNLNF